MKEEFKKSLIKNLIIFAGGALALLVLALAITPFISKWSYDKGTDPKCRVWNSYLPIKYHTKDTAINNWLNDAATNANGEIGFKVFREAGGPGVDIITVTRAADKEYKKGGACEKGTGAEYQLDRNNETHKPIAARIIVCAKLKNVNWTLALKHELTHSVLGMKHVEEDRCNLMCKKKPKGIQYSPFELSSVKHFISVCKKNERVRP